MADRKKTPGFPHPTAFERLHWACVEALSAIRCGEETDGHLAHLANVLNMARNRRGMMPLVPDPPRDHLSDSEGEITRQRALIAEMREVLGELEWREAGVPRALCQWCGGVREESGHRRSCKLRDLLDRTEGYGGDDSE